MGWQQLFGGIRRRLLFSLSLLVASIAAFVLFFFPARLEEQAISHMKERAAAIRDITAFVLADGVAREDVTSIQEHLREAWRSGSVVRLAVRDTSGRVLAMLGRRGANGVADLPDGVSRDERMYVTEAPIVHRGATVGTLEVGLSLDTVREDVAEARRLGFVVAGLILLGGFVIVFTISTVVTRPLAAVAHAVRKIGGGDLTIRAIETSDSDLTQFVRSFNQMVENLVRAQNELAQANQQLEQRVDERTAQLRSALADQRRAQEALEESERQARLTSEMLRTLIDVAPQAIMTVDTDWRLTRWNRAAEQLFGWSREEVLGKPLPYNAPEGHQELRAMHERNTRGGGSHTLEAVRFRKDGTPVHVLTAVGALRDEQGETTGYIAVITDITERRSLEEQLRQSQKMEAIGRLSGGIAHDFNNVLTVITSSASMLLDGEHSAEDRADIEAILMAARRASALTRQLLVFSRRQVVQHQNVRLNQIVTGMQPMLRRLLREDIDVRVTLAPELGQVKADPAQLEQVLLNLVLNAADAMPAGGVLSITTEHIERDDQRLDVRLEHDAPGLALLRVTDTGIGMDARTLERIFEPFFTTKPPGQGTGLGLPTCYAVIEQIGGHIRVRSTPGAGSEFRIFIPLVTAEAAAEESAPEEAIATSAEVVDATVLLVEDDEVVRRGIRRGLERLGYRVLEATDGEHALVVAAENWHAIDVVVTDVMMPRMNGRSLADRLVSARPRLPVIFMSGYTGETVSQHALVDATHAFLQKPFELAQLGQLIRDMLQPGRSAGQLASHSCSSSGPASAVAPVSAGRA